MRRRFIVSMSALFALLPVLASLSVGQASVRVPPPNDDFANAIPITMGDTYTVPNISEATVELGQPSVSSCGLVTDIYHSVWYSFVLPNNANLSLSTSGTVLSLGLVDGVDTVMAVFTGASLGTLSQVACNDNNGTLHSELNLSLSSSTTYYVLVGSKTAVALNPSSVLRLVTRMKQMEITVINGDFEDPFTSTGWSISNATGDDRVCGDAVYTAFFGACAFRFVGGAGEASRLKLKQPWDNSFIPRKNGQLGVPFWYKVLDSAIGSAKVKVKVTYSDGKPPTSTLVDLSGTAVTGPYLSAGRILTLASKNIASVSMKVVFKSTTGTLMIDLVKMIYVATTDTRKASVPVLGVPKPPN